MIKCGECGKMKDTVEKRKQNTAYEDDKLNYIECCKECFDNREAMWVEMWAELGR